MTILHIPRGSLNHVVQWLEEWADPGISTQFRELLLKDFFTEDQLDKAWDEIGVEYSLVSGFPVVRNGAQSFETVLKLKRKQDTKPLEFIMLHNLPTPGRRMIGEIFEEVKLRSAMTLLRGGANPSFEFVIRGDAHG